MRVDEVLALCLVYTQLAVKGEALFSVLWILCMLRVRANCQGALVMGQLEASALTPRGRKDLD